MATLQYRNRAINVRYPYYNDDGEYKTHWETYYTELEAVQRKALIDLLQKNKDFEGIRKAVKEYKEKKNLDRIAKGHKINDNIPGKRPPSGENNLTKTVKEFMYKWLPYHARKRRFSPNSVDSYDSIIREHILDYFGNRIMSLITGEEWDEFFDCLTVKPIRGSKANNKKPEDVPPLAPSTIVKIFNVVIAALKTAKAWKYILEIPDLTSPKDKSFKKRAFWLSDTMHSVLEHMPNEPQNNSHLLHLAVHMAYVGTLRAGEVTGVNVKSIDLDNSEYWVEDEVQRVSDKSLEILPKNAIKRVFPKMKKDSSTSLILKDLKTEQSVRNQYMTRPLKREIGRRLKQIEINKLFFGSDYNDYGLLICHSNGDPIEPRLLDRWFKKEQRKQMVTQELDFQGIRKSADMHKKRLTPEVTDAMMALSGHGAEVTKKHYDEELESDKWALIKAVERDFYTKADFTEEEWQEMQSTEATELYQKLEANPDMLQHIMHMLQANVPTALDYNPTRP